RTERAELPFAAVASSQLQGNVERLVVGGVVGLVRVRPQRAGGVSSGSASAIIRSTISADVGTSATSPTPQPAYIAMAATSPVVETVGGWLDQRTTSQL